MTVRRSQRDGSGRRGSLALGWGLHAGVVAASALAPAIDRRLRRTVDRDVPLGASVVIGGYWAALAVLERLRPFRADWNRPRDRDAVVDVGFAAMITAANLASQAVGHGLGSRFPVRANLSRLPAPVAVGLTVLVYDLFHSQGHRLGHVWGPAWRYHSVHHSPTRLYWFNATRFHTVETMIDGFVDGFVVAVAGLDHDQQVAYLALRGTYGQLQHCNADVRSGVLDRVFSTPDLHRWHHSTDYDEGDTNYGAVTSVWDQLLGTFFRPDRDFDATVGVGRMPNFPTGFVALERAPWQWEAIRAANAETWIEERHHG